ncbi:MAG: hypothetical protein ABSA34_05035 [Candidatus Goldiibacteriota bacterium]|jgi:hypothetical protein
MKKGIISILIALSILFVPVLAMAERADSDVIIDETVLEPKDPILATVLSIGPGLLVHGWGHYYTEDYRMGLLLTGTEMLSIGAMWFGAWENTSPDAFAIYGSGGRQGGAITFAFGFLLFMGSWFADIYQAGRSAEQYNTEHNLEFKVQQESLLKGNGGTDSIYAAAYNIKF